VEEICEAFDEMQQKNSTGPGEDIDNSATGIAPSSTDGLADSNHQAYDETSHLEDQEEKLEQKDADKSVCSSDEPHGLEHCSRGSDGNDLVDFSVKKKKKASENGIKMKKDGKTPVDKATFGAPSVKEDYSTCPHPTDNGRIGAETFSEAESKGALPSNCTAYQDQDCSNSVSPTRLVDGVWREENTVNVQKVTGVDSDTTLVLKEPTDVDLKVKKNHVFHKKARNISAKENEKITDGDGITGSDENSPKLDNETGSGKRSHNLKKSKKHASEKDALPAVQKGVKVDTVKPRLTEGSSSSHLQGKKSLLSRKKQKADTDDSRPAKRPKCGDEDADKISRNSDSSHFTGKVRDKVVKSKQKISFLQDEVDMVSNLEKHHDRKHVVVKDATHPPSKRSSRVSESTSISAPKSATLATGKSPGLVNDGISLTTHGRTRRRAFLLDDDDDEEVHRTPVHRHSSSILISAHSNGQVAESCIDSASIMNNASTEILHFKSEGTSSTGQASPLKAGGVSSSPNTLEKKEIKPEKELGPQISHSPVKPECQKTLSGEERAPIISPKTKMAEHKPIKPQVKSSGSASTKKVQGSSSRPSSIHASASLSRTHNQEATIKNQPSSTSVKLNVNPKSNAVISLVPENRSNINFSAEPNIEKDALLGERYDISCTFI